MKTPSASGELDISRSRFKSCDYLPGAGCYDFTGLSVYNWTIDDRPFNPVGIIFEQLTIGEFVATLQGDYNGDGRVDVADYTVWRDQQGTDLADADGNNDGMVNELDYGIWRRSFGSSMSASLQVSTVPEPAGWMLAWAMVALVVGSYHIGDLP